MMRITSLALALMLTGCAATPMAAPRLASDAQIAAAEAEPVGEFATEMRWNERMAPFTILGKVHYVGTAGIGVFLITTLEGHVLIDGALAQSVPQILDNIRTLGFEPKDVKYILNTHGHFDHAAGLAGLQRASGAKVIASAADKPYLEAGHVDHGPTKDALFPPVRVDRTVGDGDTITLAGTTLTAHLTPGHSPGCTSWSLTAKDSTGMPRKVFLHCTPRWAASRWCRPPIPAWRTITAPASPRSVRCRQTCSSPTTTCSSACTRSARGSWQARKMRSSIRANCSGSMPGWKRRS